MKKVLIILFVIVFFGSAILSVFFDTIGYCDLAKTFYTLFLFAIMIFFSVLMFVAIKFIKCEVF